MNERPRVGARTIGVIVNYNTTEDLARCVQSLFEENVDEIHVVDNASRQNQWEGLVTDFAADARVRLCRLPANIGFGAAVNLAIRRLAKSDGRDLVWIVNPDLVVHHGAHRALRAALSSADIVSPVIFSGGEGREWVWFGGGVIDTRRGWVVQHAAAPPGGQSVVPTHFVTGAAPLMRLQTWRALGGFRADLFLYWEDVELCLRAREHGMVLGVVPSATAWHRVGGSGDAFGKSVAYYYFMSRNRLVVCGQARWSRLDVALGRGLPITLRLLLASARESQGRWRKMWAVWRGTAAALFRRP